MTMYQRIAKNVAARGLALAAAGVIGLAAMGDVAIAGDSPSVKEQLGERLAHNTGRRHSHNRDVYDIRCETAAIRANGRRLQGTYTRVVRDTERQACRVALRECRQKLAHERRNDRRAYPFATCKVVDTDRIVRRRGRGPSIILRF